MARAFLIITTFLLFFSGRADHLKPGTIYFQASYLSDNKPVIGAVFAIKGGYNSKPTTNSGQTEIKVPLSVAVGEREEVMLVSSNVKNLVLISPWGGGFSVPKFDNDPSNRLDLYLIVKGDRLSWFNSSRAIEIITNEINNINDRISSDLKTKPDELAKTVEDFSDVLGASPEELDKAIREADEINGAASTGGTERVKLFAAVNRYKQLLPDATNKFAPNLSGKWTATMNLADGSQIPLTYNLSTNGNVVTGIVISPYGENMITNGTITGNNFTFDFDQGGQNISQKGVFKKDSLVVSFDIGEKTPLIKVNFVRKK